MQHAKNDQQPVVPTINHSYDPYFLKKKKSLISLSLKLDLNISFWLC